MALSKDKKHLSIVEETNMYKQIFSNLGHQDLLEKLKKKASEWKSTKIEVAITGDSGTGKSTFINKLFGLKDNDAAKTDIVECTKEIKKYASPINPNVIVADLPGVGTPSFPKMTYVRDVDLGSYEFFIIIAKCRFTENDTWLAREIKNLGKRFYFVRSHVQDDIDNDESSYPESHDPEKVIQKIRNDCTKKLGAGFQTEVFVIDSFETDKYDFGKLVKTFIHETTEVKAMILVESVAPLVQEILDLKYQALQEQIISVAVKFVEVKRKTDSDQIARRTINEEMAYYGTVFGISEERLKDESELFKLSEIESDSTSVDLEELCSKLMETAECKMLQNLHYLGMQELMKEFEVKLGLENCGQPCLTTKILFCILHRLYEFASNQNKRVPA